jgi:hypothetical protein
MISTVVGCCCGCGCYQHGKYWHRYRLQLHAQHPHDWLSQQHAQQQSTTSWGLQASQQHRCLRTAFAQQGCCLLLVCQLAVLQLLRWCAAW